MSRLGPAHGAAVEIVDWCRRMRRRPTHMRQLFLEHNSPELLAYFEALDASASPVGWRVLDERINRAVREYDMKPYPCGYPWHVGIWLLLPGLAAIGRAILEKQARANAPNLEGTPLIITDKDDDAGSDDGKGGGDKTGTAGSSAKPLFFLSRRLQLSFVPAVMSDIERQIFDLNEEEEPAADDINGIDGPDETDNLRVPVGFNGGNQ